MPVQPTAPTRERLLAATVDCLRSEGLGGLTSREITARAGANLQAITYHFGSKDALVAAALTQLVENRLAPIRTALETDGEPALRLVAALATIKETFAVGRSDLATYADALAACSTNAELARSLGELHATLTDYLAGLVAEMQSQGYIQSWVEPTAVAALLIALGDGLAAQARFGEPDVAAVLDQVALLLLSSAIRPST